MKSGFEEIDNALYAGVKTLVKLCQVDQLCASPQLYPSIDTMSTQSSPGNQPVKVAEPLLVALVVQTHLTFFTSRSQYLLLHVSRPR